MIVRHENGSKEMSQEQAQAVTIRMQDLSSAYAEIMVIGKVLQMSGYFRDVADQAQAVTKILFGRELGFSPIVSMSGIYIIEGKPALSANLLAATIKRSGKYDYRIVKWDNTQCEIMFKEKMEGKWEEIGPSSFNLEDAKRAGCSDKGPWKKYPKAMLFARALSQGERAYCPDVSACPLYVPEELGATVNESGEVLSMTDLPTSAQPLARTTEETVFTAPKKASPVEQAVTPPTANMGSEPSMPLPPAAVDANIAATSAPAPKPDTGVGMPQGCITDGQAANFHRTFAAAMKADKRKDAKLYAHQWLQERGFVDSEGHGTAKAIAENQFLDVRDEAAKGAATI